MKKKYLKIFGVLLGLIFALLGFTSHSQQQRQFLEVDFLDVGQGDAVLIKTPFEQNILIDGGPSNKVLSELGNNLAFFDKNIDLLILTHPHSDHVAGLVEVLRRYKVKKVLMTGVAQTTPDYQAFLKEIDKQNIVTEKAVAPKDFILAPDLTLRILYPMADLSGQKVENLNNSSIVSKLIYKDTSFLLTGDAEGLVEADLLAQKIAVSANVLKVSHHGSKYSSSAEFLDAVKPQYAVISVGKDNDFGHPHLRTLNLLVEKNIPVFQTDELGTLKFFSDGQKIFQN